MSVGRRREATRRYRRDRQAAAQAQSIDQANLSAYALAGIGVALLVAFSINATDGFAAVGLACQTGTVLLVSPELIRPLGRLGYLRRPLSRIRSRRRRIAYLGMAVLVTSLFLLGMRVLDLAGFGSDTDLLGLAVFLAMILGFLGAFALLAVWQVEGLFEGAAETWLQSALRELDPRRATEVRLAIAATLFLLGTLLLFVDAYR
jgi:hypothetical protein